MDQARFRKYVARVAPEKNRVESFFDHAPMFESALESAPIPAEATLVTEALQAVDKDEPLTDAQFQVLEAIVLPKERPVVDVIDGTFEAPDEPFRHLGDEGPRKVIKRVLPSIGRIELPGHPSLPFGGTGFVVGEGLLMTNRHVAELFAQGLGREGLVFLADRQAGVDFVRERGRDATSFFQVERILMIHPYWDMALLAVTGLSADHPPLTLSTADPGDLVDREVVVIGYPALDTRNNVDLQNQIFGSVFNVKRLQPGKVGDREQIESFTNVVLSVTHDCSTLGGNSGSAVIDVETGSVVALHFAGRYLEANYAVPAHALSLDGRVVDTGLRFDGEVRPVSKTDWDAAWEAVERAPAKPVKTAAPRPAVHNGVVPASAGTATAAPAVASASSQTITVNVPLEITVRLGSQLTVAAGSPSTAAVVAGTEAMVEPFREEDLTNRRGYDEMFLGVRIPMPKVRSGTPVSKLDDGSTELKYEHFSCVMNKDRRLAHFLAANVDGSEAKTKPEPGRDYSRKGLTGLGPNHQEKWFTDPRIPAIHQLPDRFFTKDRKAFDKGHIIRRTYVAWGDTFDQLRRANGDTYHVTNCSPQVAAFNQSSKQGIWGQLEDIIQKQASDERYCVFAGPVFRDDDPDFEGVDERGRTVVKIPQTFWKIIVARTGDQLQTFAFKLEQDLSTVDFTELAFEASWNTHMISIAELEELIGTLRFPDALHESDQSGTDIGESLRGTAGVELVAGSLR